MGSLISPIVKFLSSRGSFIYIGLQLGGIVTLFFGISLIVGCTVTISRIALPLLATPGTPYFFLLWITCSVLSFTTLFNYVAAASFTSPCVDAEETMRLAIEGDLLSPQKRHQLLDEPSRYCKSCRRYKAPREHHCRVCNRCVAKMDHHCPWINNCVDAENHRYFFLLIVYLFLSTGIAFFLLLMAYVRLWWHGEANGSVYGPCGYRLRSFPLYLTFALCGTIFACMIFFIVWSGLHILKNETQIERVIVGNKERLLRNSMVPFRNPYDLGRWRNLLTLLETNDDPVLNQTKKGGTMMKVALLLWLALPTLRSSTCDGVHYPTFDDEVMLPV